MKNKKGFTLIELLAVIVILAIIALIATPVILNIIEKSKKASFTRSAENVVKAGKTYFMEQLMFNEEDIEINFNCNKDKCISEKTDEQGNPVKLEIEGSIGTGEVSIDNNGNISLELSNHGYCATKEKDEKKITVSKGNCGKIDPKDDTTKPEIRNVSYTKTNNSIKIVVSAKDEESGISYYEYSIDDGVTYTEKQTSNIYEYKNLSLGTYKIKVKVYNGAYDYKPEIGVIESEGKEVTLEVESCPIPEILSENPEGWAQSKEITIDYGSTPGCIGTYSIDNGTTFIEGTTVTTSNKDIILKNTTGTKNFTKSYSLKIDNEEPNLTIENIETTYDTITINYTVEDKTNVEVNCEYGETNSYGSNGTIENNTCTINNLKEKTTYYYKITAIDEAENSMEPITDSIQTKDKTTYIEMVYYNPETGTRCTESEYNTNLQSHINAGNPTVTNLKSGCMKWYAYHENEDGTYDMILDHNTTAKVQYNSSQTNTSQKEVAQALETDTGNWRVSARLITEGEIRNITGNTGSDGYYCNGNSSNRQTIGSNKYSWLFDYTNNCTIYGCNVADSSTNGYWTSTPKTGNSFNAWCVDNRGFFGSNLVNYNIFGLRPVITIPK